LTAPTAAPVRSIARITSVAGIDHPVDEAADDGGEREVGADRKVDAARQDHQLLAHRDDGDDGRLGDDVADVAGLRKFGVSRLITTIRDEDQQRADARSRRPMRDRIGALVRRADPGNSRTLFRLLLTGRFATTILPSSCFL
jgi:hypothetical protein